MMHMMAEVYCDLYETVSSRSEQEEPRSDRPELVLELAQELAQALVPEAMPSSIFFW